MSIQLSEHIKLKTGKSYPHLKALSFKSQIVGGTNYFVKVDAGDEHLHLRIFMPLPCYGDKPELHNLQESMSKNDPIEYF